MGAIKAICISEKKGTNKHPVPCGDFLEDYGISNDAHAGKWHRQVSLLPAERVREHCAVPQPWLLQALCLAGRNLCHPESESDWSGGCR